MTQCAGGASVVVVFMVALEELSEDLFSCTGGGTSTVELEELSEERCSSVICAIRREDSD